MSEVKDVWKVEKLIRSLDFLYKSKIFLSCFVSTYV